MPLQSPLTFGVALAVLGGINIVLAPKVLWRMRVVHRDEIDLGHWIWHFSLPLVVGLLFAGTAIGFFLGKPFAPLGLPITDLLCPTIGLRNTWVLTVWLALHRERPSQPASTNVRHEKKVK